ncbi:MAG: leucine-rich repeat protein [Clostridia bacterium]|nr:leucine-rich repeat protein [Clostridia bacterium]
MKKILSICVILTFLLSTVCAFSASAEPPATFVSGDYIYTINPDGTAEIMDYTGNAEILTIPEELDGINVTSIGYEAFRRNETLKSVTISDSITKIGTAAFTSCTKLEAITLPENLENFKYTAIENTPLYKNPDNWEAGTLYISNHLVKKDQGPGWDQYEVKEGTISICNFAFEHNSKLKKVTLPQSLKRIGNGAFSLCAKLEQINLPENLTYLGNGAFENCTKLKEINIPSGIEVLSECAFNFSGLREVTIPSTIKAVGNHAFSSCQKLEKVIISEGVKYIEHSAFSNCPLLNDITLPDSLEDIGDNAFNNTAYANNPENLENGALYWKDVLLEVNPATKGKFYVKEGTKKIAGNAFYGCDEIIYIHLPNSVEILSEECFAQCGELKRIDLSENIKEIPKMAFWGCSELENIRIPASVEKIGDYAFLDCFNLESITIFDSVTEIGEYAAGFITTWDQEGCIVYESGVAPQNLTVYGYNGTEAEKYAKKNGFDFKDMHTPAEYKYKDKVLELLDITDPFPEIISYSEVYEYFSEYSTNDEATPYYVLITAFYSQVKEGTLTRQFGDYVLYTSEITYPSEEFGYFIYLPKENKIYTLTEAYEKKIDGINNVFTEAGLGKLIGDVNYDLDLNIRDVTLIQKHIAELENLDDYALDTSYTELVADFNGDNKINVKDATAIQKRIAGLDGKTLDFKVLGVIPTAVDYSYTYKIAQSPEELTEIADSIRYASDWVKEQGVFTEEYFKTKAVVVVNDIIGGSCCSQEIEHLGTKGDTLTVLRTIRRPLAPNCDENPQCVMIEVNREDIKDVFNVKVHSETKIYNA